MLVSTPASSEDVRAIENLVVEFAYRVDFESGMTVSELFCADGCYELDGQRSTGRPDIKAAYEKRAAMGPRTARHIFTNLRVRPLGNRDYQGSSIMLLSAEDEVPPLPATPLQVADVVDHYCFQDGRPLLRSRTLTSIFLCPGSSTVLPLGQETAELGSGSFRDA